MNRFKRILTPGSWENYFLLPFAVKYVAEGLAIVVFMLLLWPLVSSITEKLGIREGRPFVAVEALLVIMIAFIMERFLFATIIGIFVRSSLEELRDEMSNRHPVSMKFTFRLLNDAIGGQHQFLRKHMVTEVKNVLDIPRHLEMDGLVMKHQVFAQLLATAASCNPHHLSTVWYVPWYPPSDVFKGNRHVPNTLEPGDVWRDYFDNLDDLYESVFLRLKDRRRIFVVEDEVLEKMKNSAFWDDRFWRQLLLNQQKWKIPSQWFVSRAYFDHEVDELSGLRDFVIFQGLRRPWIVGQKEKDGKVQVVKERPLVQEYERLYQRLTAPNHSCCASLKQPGAALGSSDSDCVSFSLAGKPLYDLPL